MIIFSFAYAVLIHGNTDNKRRRISLFCFTMPLTQTVAKATSKLAHSSCCSNSEQICTHSSSGRILREWQRKQKITPTRSLPLHVIKGLQHCSTKTNTVPPSNSSQRLAKTALLLYTTSLHNHTDEWSYTGCSCSENITAARACLCQWDW